MESVQNLKKHQNIQAIDMGAGFAIIKLIKHTAFLCASKRRQFFYGK